MDPRLHSNGPMSMTAAPSTWILVAHRGGGRLYSRDGTNDDLVPISRIDHAAGRLRAGDLSSDRVGRSKESMNQTRHGVGEDQDPTEHEASVFAKQLAATLETGRIEHRFDRLVLVAEPRFLGLLKAELSRPTALLITETIDKDFAHLTDREIGTHLGGAAPRPATQRA